MFECEAYGYSFGHMRRMLFFFDMDTRFVVILVICWVRCGKVIGAISSESFPATASTMLILCMPIIVFVTPYDTIAKQ